MVVLLPWPSDEENAAWWNTTTFQGEGEAARPLRSQVACAEVAVRPSGSEGSLLTKKTCTGPRTTS